MDIAAVTAAPSVLVVGGKTYRVNPLSFLASGMLQVWINDHAQSPYALAKEEADRLEVPEVERESWLADPRAKSKGWKPPEVGVDPGWLGMFLHDPDGRLFFLYVALQGARSDIEMAEVETFAAGITMEDFNRIVRFALDMDDEQEEDTPGPKGPSPAASTPS